MPCKPEVLRQVPLFSLLDDDETAVLASQVELRTFAPRQRIWKIGDPSGPAYVVVSGTVRLDHCRRGSSGSCCRQPARGEFFGFASLLDQTPHQTNAQATEESVCVEVDRNDISVLLERKPHAGMDMLSVLGRQFHASQRLVRLRAARNPNVVIEEKETVGERIADTVASLADPWTFIIAFLVALVLYSAISISDGPTVVGPLSFYSAQSIFVDAGGDSGAGHHDEPEPAGQKRSSAQRIGLRRQPPRRKRDSGAGSET